MRALRLSAHAQVDVDTHLSLLTLIHLFLIGEKTRFV